MPLLLVAPLSTCVLVLGRGHLPHGCEVKCFMPVSHCSPIAKAGDKIARQPVYQWGVLGLCTRRLQFGFDKNSTLVRFGEWDYKFKLQS